jgi:hypothetical protein
MNGQLEKKANPLLKALLSGGAQTALWDMVGQNSWVPFGGNWKDSPARGVNTLLNLGLGTGGHLLAGSGIRRKLDPAGVPIGGWKTNPGKITGGIGISTLAPAKDLLVRAQHPVATLPSKLDALAKSIAGNAPIDHSMSTTEKTLLGLLGAGAVGGAGYMGYKGVKALDAVRRQKETGKLRMRLPSRDPYDQETELEMPIDEVPISSTMWGKLRRDFRRKLIAETRERTKTKVKGYRRGDDKTPDNVLLMDDEDEKKIGEEEKAAMEKEAMSKLLQMLGHVGKWALPEAVRDTLKPGGRITAEMAAKRLANVGRVTGAAGTTGLGLGAAGVGIPALMSGDGEKVVQEAAKPVQEVARKGLPWGPIVGGAAGTAGLSALGLYLWKLHKQKQEQEAMKAPVAKDADEAVKLATMANTMQWVERMERSAA